jgi:hypothetical protein
VIDLLRFQKIFQGDNMKLAKLSLAAMVVAGLASSSFAADTLADAFAKGKVSGELRAWYFDRDTSTANESIINTALVLGYVTDSFYGFSMGATMQSNYAPFADDAEKNMFYKDMYGSGAVLSEAYLAYKMKNTTAKVGRQFIATPLVAGSGSRIVKEAFEGAVLINTDLPATTLIAGYVSKFQGRTTGALGATMANSDIPEFTKVGVFAGAGVHAFDGAYTAAIINKSIPNLTLTGQYARVMDVAGAVVGDVDVYHLEAGYVLPMSSFELGFGLAYRASSTDKEANLDGNYMGAKVSISKLAGFGASFAYGTSDNTDGLIAGMGNGADSLYTGTVMRGGGNTYKKDTDSYLFAATYDFSKVGVAGLTALAQYAVSDQGGTTGADYTTFHLGASYAVPALKGLTVTLQYETQEVETTTSVDLDEVRFMANYKF